MCILDSCVKTQAAGRRVAVGSIACDKNAAFSILVRQDAVKNPVADMQDINVEVVWDLEELADAGNEGLWCEALWIADPEAEVQGPFFRVSSPGWAHLDERTKVKVHHGFAFWVGEVRDKYSVCILK
jgi:hypothetical protein